MLLCICRRWNKSGFLATKVLLSIVSLILFYFGVVKVFGTRKPGGFEQLTSEYEACTPSFSPIRVLCYILLEDGKQDLGRLIKRTWAKNCDHLVFYGSASNNDGDADQLHITSLNVTEGYSFLWAKTKAAITHLQKTFSHEYKWFLKADVDTFVIMENLKELICRIGDERAVWFGFKMKHAKMKQGYMSGGSGYVFNSKALEAVVDIFQNYPTKNYIKHNANETKDVVGCRTVDPRGVEDLELGRCFYAAGVEGKSVVDELGRERFIPLSISAVINDQLSPFHWIWHQAWNRFRTGTDCCSSTLISIHEVSPAQIRLLYFLIYQLRRPSFMV